MVARADKADVQADIEVTLVKHLGDLPDVASEEHEVRRRIVFLNPTRRQRPMGWVEADNGASSIGDDPPCDLQHGPRSLFQAGTVGERSSIFHGPPAFDVIIAQ